MRPVRYKLSPFIFLLHLKGWHMSTFVHFFQGFVFSEDGQMGQYEIFQGHPKKYRPERRALTQ